MTVPAGIDATVPNAARMYDYYLGGKDNYAADRAAAERVLAVAPDMREAARASRALIKRVVTHLVRERGIRQFLDLGSGLPAAENVHEIAREIDPSVRVVYVDHDEVVCIHGRALLCDPDRVVMVHGDVREPQSILGHPELLGLLDLDQPVAVLMMFLLHLIPESDNPRDIVAAYREAVVPGSYLAISHATTDARPEYMARIAAIYKHANTPFTPRPKAEVEAFVGDFEPDPEAPLDEGPSEQSLAKTNPDLAASGYGVVARKP